MLTRIGFAFLVFLWALSATAQTNTPKPPKSRATVPQQQQTQQGPKRIPWTPNKANLGPPKSGPKTTNPFAAQKSAAILTQLDQQRKATDKEVSEMKLGLRPAQAGTLMSSPPASPSNTSANRVPATAPTRMSAVQAPSPAAAKPTNVRPTTTGPAPSTLLKPAGPGAIGPERTTATGTVSSAILRAPNPVNALALTCTNDPTMRILNVSGSYYPATFTSIEKYDSYTITGCSLGDPGPNAKVYLYKDMPQGSGFPLQFQILEWHDNWIHLQLDWNRTGLFDQDNLTLVVQRADGKQADKGGFKFYAARETLKLDRIPRGYFSLDKFTTSNYSNWTDIYNSPASKTDGYGFGGMTAEVQWDENLPFIKGNFGTAGLPSAGTDIYDLSHLQPGFVATAASIGWYNADCDVMGGSLITAGNFGAEFKGSQLWVAWQGQNCKNVQCGGFMQGDCFWSPLTYGLDVWVEGPRGIDPWTGLPTKH